MTRYDVFNGDADGLCALQQLRLAEPAPEAVLVTGVKRDIALLERVDAGPGDAVTVLDVSLEKNLEALLRALDAGASVRYVDHHFPGEIPKHDALEVHVDPAPETCTGLIVNALLGGAHLAWAVTAAFGDNLLKSAREAAAPLGLDEDSLGRLQELGTLLNYNGYGATLEDLHFDPAALAARLRPWADPLAFAAEDVAFAALKAGYADDRSRVDALRPERESPGAALYVLPDAAWARRIGGVWANELAQAHRGRAHALLTGRADGAFVVSVRAPIEDRTGADELCRRFETGGGRQAAAGINRLPPEEIDRFAAAFEARYGS